jgi:propionyl-CoA carboxylase alpha chain
MIRRLLIANRGEIAVRIARTAHRMGIDTVAVYSEPDATALHVDSVDVAVALGGFSAAESYLGGDTIIGAALAQGCDAIHPGYGFLAEDAAFARSVVEAGLIWVGPRPEQIELLGDKVAAKQAAAAAGVPTTEVYSAAPGAVPVDVPLPALVKAAAGGGGRGMRVVRRADELEDAVVAAAREAAAAFGDGAVFIEPYIEQGRHVEVQIIGDSHGNVIHVGERECSIQRRNQKIIEETPSVGITPEIRSVLFAGALALARRVGYVGAGTVEFLVGDDGTITFLEVNTRLQVEHPVTEAVTGLDLVELQLRVAAGESLPLAQDDVVFDGHAIEARVVAEDPAAGWLPATGKLGAFEIGTEIIGDGVRVDTGFRSGATIPADYDSLLAKVIAHAPSRAEAARVLAKALRTSLISGVATNVATLVAILDETDFLAGRTPTSYLEDHPSVADPPGADGEDAVALLLGGVFAAEQRDRAADRVTGFAPSGWRNLRTRGQRQVWRRGDVEFPVEYIMDGPGRARVWLGPWPEPLEDGSLRDDGRRVASIRLLERTEDRQVVEVDGRRQVVQVSLNGARAHTTSRAGSATWTLVPRFVIHEADEAGSGPICPLPGTVIAVHVEPGQEVGDGDLLLVIEAMKMEHRIRATGAATVVAVRFAVGDRVDAGDLLVELQHAEA